MKKLYVVFECDNHRSYNSYVIKLITPSILIANKLYKTAKKEWIGSDHYLNIGEYIPKFVPECDNNILNEISVIKTTENE
jgi:hypothetical protein